MPGLGWAHLGKFRGHGRFRRFKFRRLLAADGPWGGSTFRAAVEGRPSVSYLSDGG